ncbi:Nitroreductase [Mytilinidion resinicola]|uniref:Nitroreductase n=1 Tax=Mytilinidion resinicola TaxID=574789 RepID=A0A6A6YXZ9_9PEZI|nr:Nitroreductase [Mytilinidion resinicola]KAF2813650.1 Nitroreductase [Mytilinidion resinicola]
MSSAFISAIAARRSIYPLSKKAILSDAKLTTVIQEAVKHAPSSFNMMSSRVVILFGAEHDAYWNDIVPGELKKVVPDEETFAKGVERTKMFGAAAGTVLFFEDGKVIKGMQENVALYADRFPQWSEHGSGMAQIYAWTALELEGYGANLQHYGNLTGPAVTKKYGLPDTYSLKAELVFGHPEGSAKEKPFLPDAERVKTFGSS